MHSNNSPSNNPFLGSQSTKPLRIGVLGECMVELSGKPLSPLHQSFSGDTLNTAIYLRRLTESLSINIAYATALGTDAFSKAMLSQWQQEGIDCQYVTQIQSKNPGIYYIQVDDKGERSFSYWRNDSAARQYLEHNNAEKILDAIATMDMLYISGISVAILPDTSRDKLFSAIKQMRRAGGKLAFDNNYRPLLWNNKDETKAVYEQFMSQCDLALLTLDDEMLLRDKATTDSVLNHCSRLNIDEVVIKRGAEPCMIAQKHKQDYDICEVAAQKVETVVDTTAAGDSFSGAYIAARLHQQSPKQAAHWGHQLAGKVIQHHGAIIHKHQMPNISDLSGEH